MLARLLCGLAFLAASAPSAALPADDIPVVTELTVTTRIVKGHPIDSVRRISSSSPRTLFCFTRISKSDESDTAIRHVWYRGDEKVGESELPVRGASWRTYSKKQIPANSPGVWKVEVVDASGTVLKTKEFKVN